MSKILKNLKRKFTVLAVAMIAIQPVLVGGMMMPAKTFAGTDGVVINEIMPNPTTAEPATEWLELYNNSDTSVPLTGWTLRDLSGTPVYDLSPHGSIAAGGYLVLMGSETGIALNNLGDSIYLKNAVSVDVDAATYPSTTMNEGSSYARKPNGTGGFVWDSTPTKTGPNNIEPGKPTLTTPTTNSFLANDDVALEWNAVTDPDPDGDTVTYSVQVATDSGFLAVIKAGASLAVTTYQVSDLEDGKYFWRVLANDGYEDGEYSGLGIFTVDTEVPVITLNGDNPQTIELGQPYTELGAMVDDDNLGTSEYTSDGTTVVDTTTLDSYTVTYKAVDVAGNHAVKKTRTVNVVSPVVLSPVVTTVVPAVATVVVPEVVVVQDDQYGGYSSEQGEVKADTTDAQPDEGNKDEQKEDVKEKKNIPLWGIIFLLVLAGIGGYLFYSQSPVQDTKVSKGKKK